MWKKWVGIWGCVSVILAGGTSAQEKSLGKISFLIGDKGDVTVKHKNQHNWQEAGLFGQIWTEDQLQTKTESRCEVKLGDGSIVRIGENSSFEFSGNQNSANSWFRSVLNWGKVWVQIGRTLQPSEQFEIKAPSAVCAVRGTIYAIEADSTTRISVIQGAVDVGPQPAAAPNAPPPSLTLKPQEVPGPTRVAGPFEVSLDQWVRIVAGFQIEIRRDLKYHTQPISKNQKSDWIEWNEARDQNNLR
jgi:hypothetical protein